MPAQKYLDDELISFELPIRIRLNTDADLQLMFNIEAKTVTARNQATADSKLDTPFFEVRTPLENAEEAYREVVPIQVDKDSWQIPLDEDELPFSFLDCSCCDAQIHLVLISAGGDCRDNLYGYSEQSAGVVTFQLSNVPPDEYVILLRKAHFCGSSNMDSGNGMLPESLVNQVIRSCYMKFYDAALEYAIGFVEKNGLRQLARDAIYGLGTRDFRELSGGLRLKFTQSSWGRAQEDYMLWRSGKVPCSNQGDPWLIAPDSVSREADASDKCQFFRLLGAFHVNLDYFEPSPKGMVVPERYYVHSYFDAMAVRVGFRCVDDGGLLSDPSPCGKAFELRNDKGLRAVLHIVDMNGTYQPTINTFGLNFDYRCKGYVEGYTAEKRNDDSDVYVELSRDGKRIEYLGLFMGNCDEKAYSSFPLWQDYHKWTFAKMYRFGEAEKQLFDSFLFRLPHALWK